MTSLTVTVRSLSGLFHGRADGDEPEWPPSPFRLFQAIVAGACGGRWRGEESGRDAALAWLERQRPPEIHAPPARARNGYVLYVPSNGADAVEGDPLRIAELRVAKRLVPLAFDRDLPVIYHWPDVDSDVPGILPRLIERLHTLGGGIDPAFAELHVLTDEAEHRFAPTFPLRRYRPGSSAGSAPSRSGGVVLPVPIEGSLSSLHERHAGALARLRPATRGKTDFVQPRQAVSGRVGYGTPPASFVLELRPFHSGDRFESASPIASEPIVAALRRIVVEGFPGREALTDRFVRGVSAGPDDIERRVRFVPLPSIGGGHADRRIRRVLVEVPQGSPLRAEAVRWALEGRLLGPDLLAGLALPANDEPYSGGMNPLTGEVASGSAVLTPGDGSSDRVVSRYRPGKGARRWRSVTPMVLPRTTRVPRKASGAARAEADIDAEHALRQSLRHAAITAPLLAVRFQCEPFARHGSMASDHVVVGSRFGGRRLSHVELTFAVPVAGPLLLGDGRFAGLGLFEPVFDRGSADRWMLRLATGVPVACRDELLRQFRRALMAQVQDVLGKRRRLPALVSGHAEDGGPLRSGVHEHLFLRAECTGERIVAIEICLPEAVNRLPSDRSRSRSPATHVRLIDEAVSRFRRLRFGRDELGLTRTAVAGTVVGTRLRTRTPYVTTRRPRAGQDRDAFVADDLREQLVRSKLPSAVDLAVSIVSLRPDGLVVANVEMELMRAVCEPVLLGRTAHFGGGDFCSVKPR